MYRVDISKCKSDRAWDVGHAAARVELETGSRSGRTLEGTMWSQRSVIDYSLHGERRWRPCSTAAPPRWTTSATPTPTRCAPPSTTASRPPACPVCRKPELRHLSYVFGDELGQFSGRIKSRAEIEAMAREHGEIRVYVSRSARMRLEPPGRVLRRRRRRTPQGPAPPAHRRRRRLTRRSQSDCEQRATAAVERPDASAPRRDPARRQATAAEADRGRSRRQGPAAAAARARSSCATARAGRRRGTSPRRPASGARSSASSARGCWSAGRLRRLPDDRHPRPERRLPGADHDGLLLRRQARARPVRRCRTARASRSSEMPQSMQDAVHRGRGPLLLRPTAGLDSRASSARPGTTCAPTRSTQGGSTITQQYVKILYLSQERTYKRKIKEVFIAVKLQNAADQGRDPRGLPQHDLLRPRRLRHPGCRAGVLRQGRQGPHRRRRARCSRR